jgi:hydroxyethylthiazole kinase-like sugar kinase family protein
MVALHLATLRSQLQQAYVGMALAAAAARPFILPKVAAAAEQLRQQPSCRLLHRRCHICIAHLCAPLAALPITAVPVLLREDVVRDGALPRV